VELGRNDTVKVKVADATCLQYVKTYTPLFDCRSRLLVPAPVSPRAAVGPPPHVACRLAWADAARRQCDRCGALLRSKCAELLSSDCLFMLSQDCDNLCYGVHSEVVLLSSCRCRLSLCCAVLCCAVLCCAVLCCAVLCCACVRVHDLLVLCGYRLFRPS